MADVSSRAGRYVKQLAGFRAVIPAPLPPDPPVQLDASIISLLSRADQMLGRLDGTTETLPNPNLFVAMYVRREAVYSSQIEGTQSTLEDVLSFELDPRARNIPNDVEEVVNYIRALNFGLQRLATLPLSLRLICEIHMELLQGVRGAERSPGEFRTSQNWIGAANAPLSRATFVPPPVHEMQLALSNLEAFLHQEGDTPVLIQTALAHAQFETIHPFLDGNGRVGRLLIAFQLVQRRVLQRPLLYLSGYLKRNRAEYYDRLMAIRNQGDWEGWLRFFLRGVAETAEEANYTARRIVRLREEHRALIQESGLGLNELRLLDLLFQRPLINALFISQQLDVTDVTATRLIDRLGKLGLLDETTGKKRNRVYRYIPYWSLFQDEEIGADTMFPQTTESVP
jgi:Fic family protein